MRTGQRRGFPGDLFAIRGVQHLDPGLTKDFFNGETWDLHIAGERFAVGAVLRQTVDRHRAGCRGISDQRALRRIDLSKAARARPHAAHNRVVAAGIKDNEIDPIVGKFHLIDHPVEIDGLDDDVGLAFDRGVGRHQEIRPVGLKAVSCKKEKGNCVPTGCLEPPPECLDCGLHAFQVDINRRDDLKVQRGQCGLHQRHVVGWVRQLADRFVGAIAYHQRDTSLGASRPRYHPTDKKHDGSGRPEGNHPVSIRSGFDIFYE